MMLSFNQKQICPGCGETMIKNFKNGRLYCLNDCKDWIYWDDEVMYDE
jgi:hypothetical protein